MSLRSFHLLFILVVVSALCGFGWLLGSSEALDAAGRSLYSRICYGAAALLGPYLGWFFWKTRHLGEQGVARG